MSPKHTDTPFNHDSAQIRKPRARNADNEGLGLTSMTGAVDDVDGSVDAEVTRFINTRHRLLELARYYTNDAIDIEYSWFISRCSNNGEVCQRHSSWFCVGRIQEVLGDAVSKVVDEVYQEFGEKQDPATWYVFLNATDEQRKHFKFGSQAAFDKYFAMVKAARKKELRGDGRQDPTSTNAEGTRAEAGRTSKPRRA